MTRLHSYEVVELPRPSIAGDKLYTVIETFDGVVMGGDHHWVRKRFAVRAKQLYEHDPKLHGANQETLRAMYEARYGEAMFDRDD